MTINKNQNGNELTIALEGRLDTTTAPQLDDDLKSSLDGVESLIFDFSKLEYIDIRTTTARKGVCMCVRRGWAWRW